MYVCVRSDQQSSMPEELFFFLASLTYILDLPDLPWVFIHDYLLSFNININISILSFLFILYLVSLLFVHSSPSSISLQGTSVLLLSPNIPRRHLSEEYTTNPYPS